MTLSRFVFCHLTCIFIIFPDLHLFFDLFIFCGQVNESISFLLMGKKRNTALAISNAIAKIVLASGSGVHNAAAGTSSCIRVASAGTHRRFFDKHHKGASDALKANTSKLFSTPSSEVIIAGSPSASSVVNGFEAASVHSELGRMLKTFASATVDLFVKGPEGLVDFPEKWMESMSSNTAQKFLYELQGFGTLFSFLYFQVVQARKKYLDALKKALLPDSVEAIDALMSTLATVREMLLQPPEEAESSEDGSVSGDAAGCDSDAENENSSRRRRRRKAADREQTAVSLTAAGQGNEAMPPISSVHPPNRPRIDSSAAAACDEAGGAHQSGARAPRRQLYEPKDPLPVKAVVSDTMYYQLHKPQPQLSTSIFEFGGPPGGSGGDRRGWGKQADVSYKMSHQKHAHRQNSLPGHPHEAGDGATGIPFHLPTMSEAIERGSLPATALTTTALLASAASHVDATRVDGGRAEHRAMGVPMQQPQQPVDVAALHVGVAAVRSVPLVVPPLRTNLNMPTASSTSTFARHTNVPQTTSLVVGQQQAALSARSDPNRAPLDSLPVTPPQHINSARGWREYWENEDKKKLEQQISGCRGVVDYGRQRDLAQYGRELEAMRREVFGEVSEEEHDVEEFAGGV